MRLKKHDYSSTGWYFVTICSEKRQCIFGKIIKDKMKLNRVGRLINECWLKIPKTFTKVDLDIHQVMPNHLHGILILKGVVNYIGVSSDSTSVGKPKTVGDIVGIYKSLTTNKYIEKVKYGNWSPFNQRLWQKDYYDRVIRNENSLDRIRSYIKSNPKNWDADRNNPMNIGVM
jgi:REP element-mobilizing transposase RayT